MPVVMAAFACLPFQKGEGYPSSSQKTLSVSFMWCCSPLNRQKDGLEGGKKGEYKACLGERSERQV